MFTSRNQVFKHFATELLEAVSAVIGESVVVEAVHGQQSGRLDGRTRWWRCRVRPL